MQHEITDRERWAEVETNIGTEYIPIEQLGITLPKKNGPEWVEECKDILIDYIEGTKVYNVDERMGHGARLSMPGYLDCTEWAVFDTEEEAKDYLTTMYGEDETI